jgi:hypothetical protein
MALKYLLVRHIMRKKITAKSPARGRKGENEVLKHHLVPPMPTLEDIT